MIRKRKDLSPKNPMIIDLTGPDGNAFALLGYAKNFSKQLSLDWDSIREEMTKGDYEELLKVFDRYFGSFVILER
tara:strand:+ start:107 stop:331 length:225 start_codon:yes stop_codon:yes gene_type:complete